MKPAGKRKEPLSCLFLAIVFCELLGRVSAKWEAVGVG